MAAGLEISHDVYVLFGYGDYPSIRTNIKRILVNIEELSWMGSDFFIFCPASRYAVEYFHNGDITISWY
ncbi:hypothetical protein ACN6MY_17930 [Peribacillus sp. B-H-3]|uniref:CDI toxin immunity protein n=1 Tax=Peribacillus sp. B-H-3 TaxID=3400420 RepID=UPI003B02ADF6